MVKLKKDTLFVYIEALRLEMFILKSLFCLQLQTRAFRCWPKQQIHCLGNLIKDRHSVEILKKDSCAQKCKDWKLTSMLMKIVTKELYYAKRNNLSTCEHFQGTYLCVCFILSVHAIVCFVIIPMKTEAFYSNKDDCCTPRGIISLTNNFHLANICKLEL